MNIQSLHQADIYVTTRKNKLIQTKHGNDEFTTIDYEDRYEYLDQMDVVISATSSPHYTLTYSKMKKQLTTAKRRVFVDLAVPMDIEAKTVRWTIPATIILMILQESQGRITRRN